MPAINITYRVTDLAPIPTSTQVKGEELTYEDMDGNFRSIKTVVDDALSSLTFDDSGAGDAAGITYAGTTTRISYNTIGAASKTGSNATGTWSIDISGTAGSVDWANVLNKPANLGAYIDPLSGYLVANGEVISFANLNGYIVGSQIADAALTTAKFASGIEPITVVSSVPSTKITSSIFNTNDGKLYRWNGTAYVASVLTSDLSGQITGDQIAPGIIDVTKLVPGVEFIPTVDTIPVLKIASIIFNNADGKLYKWNGSAYTPVVNTTDLTGTIQNAQIEGLAASKITGALADSQISAISAAKISGQIVNSQIADAALTTAKFASSIEPISVVSSIPTLKTTNTIFSTVTGKLYRWNGTLYITSVASTDISGTLTSAQIASLAATKITGQLVDSQLADISAAKISGQLVNSQIADAALTTAKFASGIEPVTIVSSVPGTKSTNSIFNTTDGKLYRWNGTSYITTVASTDISGTLAAAQIASLAASQITGQLSDSQLAAISASKISDQLVNSQIADAALTTAKFASGIEPVTIVSSVPGTKSTNNVFNTTDGKMYRWNGTSYIATVASSDISGTLAAAQIASVNASAVTGQLSDTQLAAISASKISGQIVNSQIADAALTTAKFASTIEPVTLVTTVPSTKSTNNIFNTTNGKMYRWNGTAYIATVASSDISGSITDAQIAALSASKISGQIVNSQIADAALTTAKFASSIEPITLVTTVPSVKSTNNVFNTTDGKMYRWNGTAYIATVASTDISGTLAAAQIASVSASTITGQLTDSQLADISAAKLTGTITGTQITDGAITTAKIAANTITASNIAANTITASQIAASTITATQIAASTITGAKIAAGTISASNIAANTITAGQIAANTITASQIAADTITAGQIATGAITATELAANAVTAAAIAAGTITATQIAASTITGSNIAAATITGSNLVANTITAGQIAANTITASQIAANTITAGQIAAGAISATQIAAGAITTSKLFITSNGLSLNDDQMFVDTSAWTSTADVVYASNSSLSTITGSQGSSYVYSITGASNGTAFSSKKYAINPAKTYRLIANLYAAVGNNRNMSIVIRLFRADGTTELTNTDTGWGSTAYAGLVYTGQPSTAQWTTQGGLIGANTTKTIPATAAYMQVGVLFQSSASGSSAVTQACQNLYIAEAVDNSLIVDGTISGTKIVADSITATQIAAGAVTASEIAANTITAGQIAAATITTAQIAAGTIQASNIAANTITAGQIAANTITAAQIAADTITAGQIAAGAITASELAAGSVTAASILAGTITATEIAAATITGAKIAAATISASNLVANTITAGQIAAGAITATEIAAATITGAKIAAGTIQASNIAANTITASQIAANTITATQIAADTITAGQIAAGAITAAQIAAATITATQIAAGVITANEIAAATITGTNIAATTITGNNLVANTITAAQIAAATITATQIAAGTITAANIAAGTIQASNIAAGTITGDRLAANTITAAQIAADTITAGQIAAGAISASEVAAGAITTSKLFISGRGPAINDDQMFTDSSAWTSASDIVYASNGTLSTKTGAQGSSYIYSVTGGSNGWATSRKYAINPAKTYRLTANLYAATGNDRNMYIFVRLYRADGVTELTGADTGWGGSLAGYVYGGQPTIGQWTTQGGLFGYGTIRTIPTTAAYMQVGVWFQYNGSGTSNAEQACQNLYITEAVDNSLIVDGTIAGSKIVADSITASQIAADAITANELAANAVTAVKISAGAITAGKIAAGTVTALEIAAGTITASNIAANTITSSQIAANTITAGQIAAGTITGTLIAAQTIGASNIISNTITAGQIAANTITAGQIAANTITASQIAANTIQAGQIAAGAIGADQIAANAIRTDKLFVTGQGKALNDDPACMDNTAWIIGGGAAVSTTDTSAPSGTTVLVTTGSTIFRSRNFPIEAGKTYKVSTYAKKVSGTGTTYFRLYCYDAVGNLVNYQITQASGIGTYEAVTTPSTWTRYYGTVTAGTGTVYAYISISSNIAGSGESRFTDIRAEEQIGADLIVDGTISAAKMVTGLMSADNVLTRGLTVRAADGSIILAAGSPLAASNITPSTDWLNGNITVNSSGQITGIGSGSNTAVSNSLVETLTFNVSAGGTIIASGNTISKVSGTSSWTESSARSIQSYYGGAVLTFSPNYAPSLARQCAIGLNTDPDTDYSYTSIDYAFNLVGGTTSNVRIMESGTVIDLVTAWTINDVFSIQYDGIAVKYSINGVVVRTVNASINSPVYVDSSFNGVGASVNKITFAPLTKSNEFSVNRIYTFDTGVDGFTAANATLTASGGSLIVTGTATIDPYLATPVFGTSLTDGALDGSKYNIIRMKVKRTLGSSNDFQIFFNTTTHGYTEPNSVHVYPSLVNNTWAVVDINMSGVGDWATSAVTGVRFDLGNDANLNWEIDYIAFGRVSPQIPTDLLYVGSAVVGTKLSSVDGKFVVDFANKYISITV